MKIEPYNEQQADAVVDLSLRAWAPVFVSLKEVLDPPVYEDFYPEGWKVSQEKSVRDTIGSAEMSTWVAMEGDAVAGFMSIKMHSATFGEIYMIATDPNFQKRGIASKMTGFALDWMKNKGVTIAMVDTGGDPGHGPARRTYEKAGFGLLPVARYFKKL